MTREEVLTTLAPLIEGDIIRIDDYQYIEIDSFVERYKDADLTLSSLLAHPLAQPGSGWDVSFQAWHDQGILPA